jgi:hypothetical protein
MALITGYRCAACNQLIHPDELGLHLQIYPNHTIHQTIIDEASSVETSPGMTSYKDGELYLYDSDRNVKISSSRISLFWGLATNNVKNSWLKLFDASPPNGGFIIPLDSVIVKLTVARLSGTGGWSIKLCQNFSLDETLFSISIDSGENSKVDLRMNVLVEAGNTLHCFHEASSGSSNNIQVWASLAWIA